MPVACVSSGPPACARCTRTSILVGNLRLRDGLFTSVRDWQFEDRALAAYVSNAITLPDERLTITPGLRYERLDSRYFNRATGLRTRNQTRDVLPGLTVGFRPTHNGSSTRTGSARCVRRRSPRSSSATTWMPNLHGITKPARATSPTTAPASSSVRT